MAKPYHLKTVYQALAARATHIKSYVYTVFCRDYVSYVNNNGRNEHGKFEALIVKTLGDKLTEKKIEQAKKEAIADAEKKSKEMSMFGHIFG